MPSALHDQLSDLRRLLPDVPVLSVSGPLDFAFTIVMDGGLTAFVQAVQAVQPPLVFVEYTQLSESDFAWVEEDEALPEGRSVPIPLGASKELHPYRQYLGQPRHLRVFFLLHSHRIEYAEAVNWWPEFEDAIDQAYTAHLVAEELHNQSRSAQFREESQRRIAILKERLPTDDAYIKLACEPRLRITALRERGREVLSEVLGSVRITGSEDSTLRDIAADLKEKRRQMKRHKN